MDKTASQFDGRESFLFGARRLQGYNANDSNVRTKECDPRAWREEQDGYSEAAHSKGDWYPLL